MSILFEKLKEIHLLMEQQVVLQKKILTLEEASELLNISKSDLYKRTSTNSIPFYKPSGKLIYFLKEDLEAWMLSNRQASTEEIKESAANFKLNSKKQSTL